jgi:hypothetical protein
LWEHDAVLTENQTTDLIRLRNGACGAALVWDFHAAPDYLRALSDNGGDEDWIAVLPVAHPALRYGGARWVDALSLVDPQRIELPALHLVVLIGAHG